MKFGDFCKVFIVIIVLIILMNLFELVYSEISNFLSVFNFF